VTFTRWPNWQLQRSFIFKITNKNKHLRLAVWSQSASSVPSKQSLW